MSQEFRKIRWGIIGAGNIARHAVAPAIRYSSNGRLVAIASRVSSRAAALALETGAETSFGSYEKLLESDTVDAVYIGLPNGLHEEWTIKAAKAKKHVLCEKSLALDAAVARRMNDACEKAGVLLMEAFMYRHHPQWIRARDLIMEGAVGRIVSLSAHLCGDLKNGSDHRWDQELGGGALYDVTCYGVNVARYLIGSEPDKVASGARLTEKGVDSTSHAVLTFPGGVIASVHGSLETYGGQGVRVIGTDGILDIDKPFVPTHDAVTLRLHRLNESILISVPGANHFLHEVEHFANCIQAGGPLRYPAENGIANVEVCERIRKAW